LGSSGGVGPVMTYKAAKKLGYEKDFEPLPIETILRHLAQYIDTAFSWHYCKDDKITIYDKDGHGFGVIIPAPYREDWQNIKGEL